MTRIAVAAIAAAALAGLLYTLNRIDDVAVVAGKADDRLPRYTLTSAVLTRYDADGQPALKATADQLKFEDALKDVRGGERGGGGWKEQT